MNSDHDMTLQKCYIVAAPVVCESDNSVCMLGEIGTFCSVLFLGLVSTRSLIPQRFSPPRTSVVSAVEEEEEEKKSPVPQWAVCSASCVLVDNMYIFFLYSRYRYLTHNTRKVVMKLRDIWWCFEQTDATCFKQTHLSTLLAWMLQKVFLG